MALAITIRKVVKSLNLNYLLKIVERAPDICTYIRVYLNVIKMPMTVNIHSMNVMRLRHALRKDNRLMSSSRENMFRDHRENQTGISRRAEHTLDVVKSVSSDQRERSRTSGEQKRDESQVLDNWVSQSTTKFMGIIKPRSQELRSVDLAVERLAQAHKQRDGSTELRAALNVQQQVEKWEESGSSEQVSKRDRAVTQLKETTQRIIDHFYGHLEHKMQEVSASEGLSGRSWIHGTDAIAEIMVTGNVYGGTAALKLLGTDDRQREVIGTSRSSSEGSTRIERGQEQHFYMALTERDGTLENAGNAYIKGRQAADKRLRQGPQSYLPSWKYGTRPLMGVIECPSSIEDDDLFDNEKIRSIRTDVMNPEHRSTLPLSELRPIGMRMVNEGDAVRMFEYVAHTNKNQLSQLPPKISVLRDTSWKGGGIEESKSLLRDSGDYARLMLTRDPSQWRTYNTQDVLQALGYID